MMQVWETVFKFLLTSAAVLWKHNGLYETRQLWHNSYDFVVIGGGPGGAAVASRLSENPQVTVLLLESGGRSNRFTDMPYIHRSLLLNELTWFHPTGPQNAACFAYKKRVSKWGGGHVLGGSSVTGALRYVRGNRIDFDEWEAMGAKGWSSDVVLDYYNKLENVQMNRPNENVTDYRGTGGPLTVDYAPYISPLAPAFLKAAQALGHSVGDYNDFQNQLVFNLAQLSIRNGSTESADSAFLRPLRGRNNLDVVTFAHVTRVMFDKLNTAVGVQFDRLGQPFRIEARNEVILAAGTVNSAKLALLSGVGPKGHLKDMGIPMVANLPVGNNLQDQVVVQLHFTTNSTATMFSPRDLNLDNYRRYLTEGDGILTTSGEEATGFVKTRYSNPRSEVPDIQYQMSITSPAAPGGEKLWLEAYNGRQDVYNQYFRPYQNVSTLTVSVVLLRPQSIGFMKLSSADPYKNPVIEPRYLTEKVDVLHLIEGIKLMLQFTKTAAWDEYNVKSFETVMPGCEKYKMWSDAYLECYIRGYSRSGYNNAGTMRMGDPKDLMSVVDPRLRVLGGIRGLRVADGSVMPRITRGDTMAPIYMIGERAADLIKQDWNLL